MKKNMKRLMNNTSYLTKLLDMYHHDNYGLFSKDVYNDIENDLDAVICSDCIHVKQFIENAQNTYFYNSNNTVSNLHQVLSSDDQILYPKPFACLFLFVYYANEKQKLEQVNVLTDAQEIALYNINNRYMVLRQFLDVYDSIVGIMLNKIDVQTTGYLDENLNELDSDAIKMRFLNAIMENNMSLAFKLVSRIHSSDENENSYYEALSHFYNEEYRNCIRFAKKVDKKSTFFPFSLALLFESFAHTGDLDGFRNLMFNNLDMTYSKGDLIYYFMLFALCSNNFSNLDTFIDEIEKIVTVKNEEKPHYNLGLCLAAKIVIEAYEFLDDVISLNAVVKEFKLSKKHQKRLEQLQYALKFVNSTFTDYLDVNYLMEHDYAEIKKNVSNVMANLLVYKNEYCNFECIKMMLLSYLHLGQTQKFLDSTSVCYELLYNKIQEGDVSAEELLGLAYIEGNISGQLDERIQLYFQTYTSSTLEDNVNLQKINRFLTEKSKTAFDSAEWHFQSSTEHDYGLKDAGMLAFGYSRIFEVELTEKLVLPLMNSITESEVRNVLSSIDVTKEPIANPFSYLHSHCVELISCSKGIHDKWIEINNAYKKYYERKFDSESFTLGKLSKFIEFVGYQYNPNDPMATLIRNKLSEVLNEKGIKEVFDADGFFSHITGLEIREKFRNPPAHTRYMSYDLSCECREIFIELMLEMMTLFK